jgi:hypothetical protein
MIRLATFDTPWPVFKIEPLEISSQTVKEMYDLIDEYKVPCPPEDLVVYQTLFKTITDCRNSIDKSLTEREANINNFCLLLNKDISSLTEQVRSIKQQAQVKPDEWLLKRATQLRLFELWCQQQPEN